ncbi:MAG TPA: endo-1,4-beta-xylanase [Pyrinomonadaceae bacterium]|nr:endo-1,4-beta-xylanase [Pyrinomonadaceae bacterium]
MKSRRPRLGPVAFGLLLTVVATAPWTTSARKSDALKDAFKSDFLIGAALNRRQFSAADKSELALIQTHFNSITPENQLKWQYVHPSPGKFDFTAADQYVSFGEKHNMVVIGHTLVWHRQTPNWVFQDDKGRPVDRETLLGRMKEHIATVVGRYKGRIKGWDVVNEAVNADGSMRQSPWLKIIGEDYIAKAFQFAHEADPSAELYYNDYALEDAPKRAGAVRLMEQLKKQGVSIAGIGLQGHNRLDWPSIEQQDITISTFAKLGLRVNITELDVDVLPVVSEDVGPTMKLTDELQSSLNPFRNGLAPAVSTEQAKRYAELFNIYLKHRDAIDRVTLWGVTDADTWLNNWPVRGRTNYPLLFDRSGQPKEALAAVLKAAEDFKRN